MVAIQMEKENTSKKVSIAMQNLLYKLWKICYFQAETSINMGHGSSNSLPIMTKNTFWSYAALILLTFSTSFVINVFLSPKSCNEDFQSPMLPNMDGNVKIIVSCLICMMIIYIIDRSRYFCLLLWKLVFGVYCDSRVCFSRYG